MTSIQRRLFLRKGFGAIGVGLPVNLQDLRMLVEQKKANSLLLKALTKLGGLDPKQLAGLLGQEIIFPVSIAQHVLVSKIGEGITEYLEPIIRSRDSQYSTHQLIHEGVEKALLDDGKLSLLEILEKMPAEAELDINQLQTAINNFSGIKVTSPDSKDKSEYSISHRNYSDEIVLNFIGLSDLKVKEQLKVIEVTNLGTLDLLPRLAKSDILSQVETLIDKLDIETAFSTLVKCDRLTHEYNLANEKTLRVLQGLAKASARRSQNEDSNILSRSFGATVRDVRFSPDGQYLAAGSDDKSLRIWKTYDDGTTFARLFKLTDHAGEIRAIAFNMDGSLLASAGEEKTIKIWNPQTGILVRSLSSNHRSGIFSLDFSKDGTLASGSWDNTIVLWNAKQGAIKRTLEGHQGAVFALEFSPSEPILASGANDNTVRLWNTENGDHLHTFNGHRNGVFSLAFNRGGEILATGSWDRTIRLWDVGTRECLGVLNGHEAAVWQVRFSTDGRHLISSSDDKTICIWDLQKMSLQMRLSGHQHGVYGLDLSPQQPLIASGSWDKTVRFWRIDL
jgi:WD40 repeat protein